MRVSSGIGAEPLMLSGPGRRTSLTGCVHRGFWTAAGGNTVSNRCSNLSSGLDGAITHRIPLRGCDGGGSKHEKLFW